MLSVIGRRVVDLDELGDATGLSLKLHETGNLRTFEGERKSVAVESGRQGDGDEP